jgi:hypothetical protein
MDGIVKNDQKMILKFVVKCERIVKDLWEHE